MSLSYLSLFSGIGAFEKALENLNIDYNLVGFSEISKYAIKSYCAIHNETEDKSLGDITKININNLPRNIDLLTHGSPCTSFSVAGKNNGGDKGSGTPSSLMWYSVDIIKNCLPKVVIWENVANVLSKKHIHNFENYLYVLEDLGYTNYYSILNGRDFGVPQNRNRIICVSCLDQEFSFEKIVKKEIKVFKDIMDDVSLEDKKMWVQREMKPEVSQNKNGVYCVGQCSNKGSQGGKVFDVNGLFPTLCACCQGYAAGYVLDKEKPRKLTVSEAFKLMGFTTLDSQKCKDIGISDTQLYRQAGNSIIVPMLEEVFKVLYK